MASTIITEERNIEINKLDYLHKCKGCGEIKPNSEYTPIIKKEGRKGRLFVTRCRKCRVEFYKADKYKISRKKSAPEQRRKHRLTIVFNSSRGNAKKRELEHTITVDYLKETFDIQKGLCYYTGKPMLMDIRGLKNSNDSVSVDRIDSSKGYIEGNIVLCRWVVNRMKNDISKQEFLKLVYDINKNFNL